MLSAAKVADKGKGENTQTHAWRNSYNSIEKLGMYVSRQKILRNVLLFISYPTNMQQLMTKKYKLLCLC